MVQFFSEGNFENRLSTKHNPLTWDLHAFKVTLYLFLKLTTNLFFF